MHPSYHKRQVRERPHSNSGRIFINSPRRIGASARHAPHDKIHWGGLHIRRRLQHSEVGESASEC